MISPLTITKRIVLYQSDYNITSEKYILGHIEEHMKPLGMFKMRYSDNELFYIKLDPFLLLGRKDDVRNILFTVHCDNEEIRIDLKTNVLRIVLPFFFLIIGFPMSMHNREKSVIWFLLLLGLMVFGWLYLHRFLVMNSFRDGVMAIMQTLKNRDTPMV